MGSPPPPRPPDKDPPRRRERLWVCCRTLVGNRDASHVCTEATKPCRLWGLSPADVTCGPVHSFSQSVLTWRMGTAAAPLSRALDTSPLQTGAQTGECGPAGRALTELFARALSLQVRDAPCLLSPTSPLPSACSVGHLRVTDTTIMGSPLLGFSGSSFYFSLLSSGKAVQEGAPWSVLPL